MRIRGYVQDSSGTVVSDVNIYVKDKPYIGTSSSASGYFDIEVDVGETLVFSHQGYRKQHAEVKEQYPVMNITLNEVVNEIEGTTVTIPNPKKQTNSSTNGTTVNQSYNDKIKNSKKWLIISGVLLLVFGGITLYHFTNKKKSKNTKKVEV